MNKTRLLLTAVGVTFVLTMVIFIGNPMVTRAAEKCEIVTIRGRDNIEPSMLTVKKGDCVVWINFTGSGPGYPSQSVTLSFKQGEKCIRATKAPVGFKKDAPTGCYIAGWLGYGQTASLVFGELGTYDYEIQFKEGGKNTGTIIVK